MKQFIMLQLLIMNAVLSNSYAQEGYSKLSEEAIRYDENRKRIYIQTSAQPTKEQGWDSYKLFANVHINENSDRKENPYQKPQKSQDIRNPKQTALAEKLKTHKLYINKQAFTGFLRLAIPFYRENAEPKPYSGTSLSVYQFKNGKLESVETKGDVDLDTEDGVNRPKKPVLYLYPEKEQEILVKINLTKHRFSFVYPAYNNGWNVVAKPDGTLKNLKTNREHYCLFWETEGVEMMPKIESGFVLTGKETEAFLEEKLATLGLSPKEINEFVIFWLPQLENNVYNAIYFAQSEYEAISKLDISPQPNTTIRVMMLWQKLEKPMNLKPQLLPETPIRKGFVAVEWGGAEVHNFQSHF